VVKDKFIVRVFACCLALLVLSGLVVFLGLPTGSGDLILRFDNFRDTVVWAGDIGVVYGILGMVVIITLINFMLAKHIYEKEKFLSYVFAVGTGVVTLFFLIAVALMALIN
jgi:hypothetical protein